MKSAPLCHVKDLFFSGGWRGGVRCGVRAQRDGEIHSSLIDRGLSVLQLSLSHWGDWWEWALTPGPPAWPDPWNQPPLSENRPKTGHSVTEKIFNPIHQGSPSGFGPHRKTEWQIFLRKFWGKKTLAHQRTNTLLPSRKSLKDFSL